MNGRSVDCGVDGEKQHSNVLYLILTRLSASLPYFGGLQTKSSRSFRPMSRSRQGRYSGSAFPRAVAGRAEADGYLACFSYFCPSPSFDDPSLSLQLAPFALPSVLINMPFGLVAFAFPLLLKQHQSGTFLSFPPGHSSAYCTLSLLAISSVGVSTLLGSILTRTRSFPIRFLSPPLALVLSSSYFLPKTASNVSSYTAALEKAYIPSVYEQQVALTSQVRSAWRQVSGKAAEVGGKAERAVAQAGGKLQEQSGLRLQQAQSAVASDAKGDKPDKRLV